MDCISQFSIKLRRNQRLFSCFIKLQQFDSPLHRVLSISWINYYTQYFIPFDSSRHWKNVSLKDWDKVMRKVVVISICLQRLSLLNRWSYLSFICICYSLHNVMCILLILFWLVQLQKAIIQEESCMTRTRIYKGFMIDYKSSYVSVLTVGFSAFEWINDWRTVLTQSFGSVS